MTGQEREKTGELLHMLAGERTVVVTEHDMEFVRRFSNTVTVLHLGRVIKEGSMADVQVDEMVRDVYLGRTDGDLV
jgi:urea transport system ATP-binding protein